MGVKKKCPFCKCLHTYKQYLKCKKKHKSMKETWGS